MEIKQAAVLLLYTIILTHKRYTYPLWFLGGTTTTAGHPILFIIAEVFISALDIVMAIIMATIAAADGTHRGIVTIHIMDIAGTTTTTTVITTGIIVHIAIDHILTKSMSAPDRAPDIATSVLAARAVTIREEITPGRLMANGEATAQVADTLAMQFHLLLLQGQIDQVLLQVPA